MVLRRWGVIHRNNDRHSQEPVLGSWHSPGSNTRRHSATKTGTAYRRLPEASLARRKPAELGKANVFFFSGSDLSAIMKSQLVTLKLNLECFSISCYVFQTNTCNILSYKSKSFLGLFCLVLSYQSIE